MMLARLNELADKIDGPRGVRARLHDLKQESAAARAAAAALEAASRERQRAEELRHGRRVSKREFALAAIGTLVLAGPSWVLLLRGAGF